MQLFVRGGTVDGGTVAVEALPGETVWDVKLRLAERRAGRPDDMVRRRLRPACGRAGPQRGDQEGPC
jgi:hypothetical protein